MSSHIKTFDVELFTDREPYIPGGGGALNASYDQVDALANLACQLGKLNLVYGKDWYWEGFSYRVDDYRVDDPGVFVSTKTMRIRFYDERKMHYAELMLRGKDG